MILTDISLKRPVFATVVIIALIAMGIVSYMGLAINDMPDIDVPYVGITVTLPGASPDQVESKVSQKVEEAVGQISGVKHITTTVTEGVSNTVVEFVLEKSPDAAVSDVRTKISAIRGTLPQDVDEPVIQKFDMNARPIFSLAVSGTLESRDLSQLVDDVITKRLNTVKGVGAVNVYGNQEREIQIKLDKEKMASYNLTTSEVVSSLRSDNLEQPSGKVSNDSGEITLRTNGSIRNVEDFKNILIAKRNGAEIHVRDIAAVIDGSKDRTSLSFYSGKESIGIDIIKQSGSNTVTVSNDIKKELMQIKAALPPGVQIDIVRDNSTSIRDSVNSVIKTMLEGCILAVLIVFLFLGELGSTAISAVSLPTSIITTFALLKYMNFTLNTMTLMGLSLAVGLLIDDAIVVIENIVRHLRMGKPPLQAAKDGTSEIGLAVMATTFAVAAVFLPMASMSGMMGKFFIQFGLTVAFSVLVSLFVSFTLVPMLSARVLKQQESQKKGPVRKFLLWFNHLFDLLSNLYKHTLTLVLNHRAVTLALTTVLFILSLTLVSQLGSSFSPSTDVGEISISAGLDAGLTLDMAGKTARNIESIVQKYPEVRYIYTTVTPNSISLFVKLPDKKERKESTNQIGMKMREDLKQLPGLDLSISTTSSAGGPSSGKQATYHLQGNDFDQLQNYALKAKRIMGQIPGAVDVSISYKAGKPEAKLDVDREKAADLGVSTAAVADTLSTLFNGTVVSQYETNKDRYDVRVSMKNEQRRNLDSFDGIYVPSSNANGSKQTLIPLDQLTRKVFSTTSSTINRYDKAREIQVSANFNGVSQGDFNTLFMNRLKSELPLPKGISIGAGGQQESMEDSIISLVTAVLLGVLFIFLILAAQFESFIDPLAIMFSLPLAIIGALLALFVTGSEISVMSGIGFIMLLGLVTKNAILLIDFTKQQRSKGVEIKEAILQAGSIRLRPIMMTTLSMIFGMIPTALALDSGSEMRSPMAYAIIGGLISSTLLTLLVVPVMYTILDDIKGFFKKKQPEVLTKIST